MGSYTPHRDRPGRPLRTRGSGVSLDELAVCSDELAVRPNGFAVSLDGLAVVPCPWTDSR